MRSLVIFFSVLTFGSAQTYFGNARYFQPMHRLSGIGVERAGVSDAVLAKRTELMIEAQTFGIMRDSRALDGAKRITNPKLQKIFADASRQSGVPASLIAALAYLESYGDSKAQSPAGPKGIMQFSAATGKMNGLKMIYVTRYRVTKEKTRVKVKGRYVTRVVSHKTPYEVLVRDERLLPERAVPAAANYLARMEAKFGGLDLAVFAYHCGEGCVSDFLALAKQSPDLRRQQVTVPRLFFTASPVHDREIYEKIKEHMARDYSPTYFFRIKRAEQLLALYQQDPDAFRFLLEDYRNQGDASKRANSRLAVWLKPQDVQYHSCNDLRNEEGRSLARVVNKPSYFGFQLRLEGDNAIGWGDRQHQADYLQAAPSAIGTLTYIAFETRRLFDEMKPKGEKFMPLEVTSLVRPLDNREAAADGELPMHCTGHVFDVAYDFLPPHEKECLDFILNDMGWDGYLGFVQELDGAMHIGCAPSAREFFTQIYEEAFDKKHET